MKKIIKKFASFFIHLKRQESKTLKFHVLIVDSGSSPLGHLIAAINDIKKSFGNVAISILISSQRSEYMKDFSQGIEIIVANRSYIPKRFRITFELIILGRREFDFIILLVPHILPVIVSLLVLRKRLYLYNQQRRWCLLRRKTLNEHLGIIPRFIVNILVFIYLIFSVAFIFLSKPLVIKRKGSEI